MRARLPSKHMLLVVLLACGACDSSERRGDAAPADRGVPAREKAIADHAAPAADRPKPSPDGMLKTYQTTFPLNENPISENGAWANNGGPSWNKVQTVGGDAFGTQPGTGTYDDSYAHLSGFRPDQAAEATIYKNGPSGIHEVELLLRWASSSGVTRGYECLLSHNAAYDPQIVRWNGAKDDFTYLDATVHSSPVPADGDLMKATIIGNAIKVYLNSTLIAEAVDPKSTWTSGDPGVGFYITGSEPNTTYGFKDFKAYDL